ncbi:UDP-N-acetylmuramoyl-L-alanyl-D-glutamate--2,6-diaminopimelate ligase [Terrabacter sp. C0L_2]|uniref:UDP-N-acetylmuramoyl-L-alanyl-D-glutamate--2, 6-diaminopimelate ligase n=1 Tax=Terrabacter sp. C0L_2 TaxID=3108389 RepID=UPI002ED54201|nr:UDP-N-acetylmuramoyl-L-alanyl-D-glutamate--2,6-diaminopimelate ligase [Terrabacter sp. C0L_2]
MSPSPLRPASSGVLLRDLTARIGTGSRLRDAWPDGADGADVAVTGVTLDSRAVLPGDLYAALPGFNVHGARFAGDAVAAGAVTVLTDEAGLAELSTTVASDVPVIVADDPRAVLGAIAAEVYGHPSEELTMVGITGTNGKTTTAYLVESALRAHGQRTGLIGTVETRIGDERIESVRTTPEATDLHALLGLMRERDLDACVMEVSSHALELRRVDGVVYDVALFTNLSQDHLDFHPTMEDYFVAKASLFTPERSRAAVVCVDDAWGRRLAAQATVPTTTLGTKPEGGGESDWVADRVEERDAPGAFSLREPATGRVLRLVSHLPGGFNVANTALAALGLLQIGLSPAEVEAAMSVAPDVPGRMEVVAPGGPEGPRCVVDFAHTPDAVDAALAALRGSTPGRLIAVLGAGGDRDRGKRPAMGAAAARRADVVVVTDDNPRSEDPGEIRAAVIAGAREAVRDAAQGASQDGSQVEGQVEGQDEGPDRALGATEIIDGGPRSSAIAEAIALAVVDAGEDRPVDTVVVLGKGHEKGQEIHGVKHPFDDRDAVRAALAAVTSSGVTS